MTDLTLTDHQIRCVDDYLAYDRDRHGLTEGAIISIVHAIPNLEHRMQALAERRALHRQINW